ncbi:unnamed protein product [Phaedon cochleariae]|uniref:Uncharacterized protein n=1 Tax=Phaedon cochleariae TaxID=80249 RepID=A0A9N9SK77_PHACE|nr:unnamed protein product [Phaedon cochleariae]
MESSSYILKLQLITLFDSISFGLIYPFLPPYLLVLGGNNVTAGYLAVLTLICQLLSWNIAKDIVSYQGKKTALLTMFSFSIVSHLLLILTGSCWFTIFGRCIFALTNQSNEVVKELYIKKITKEETEFQLLIYNVLSSAGYIIGPVVSGCFFDTGFPLICVLAAVLTLINACLVLAIPTEQDDLPSEGPEKTLSERTIGYIWKAADLTKKSDYKQNWDILALKFLYTASFAIFFTKFPMILKTNYQSDSVTIGCTTAYINIAMFIATYVTKNMQEKLSSIPAIILCQQALVVLFFSMLIACYSPMYPLFALSVIPITFGRSYITTSWRKVYSERNNEFLDHVNDYVGILVGLTIPILFGIVCDMIKFNAVVLFSILPVLLALYILNKYTCDFEELEGIDKSKDD